jgi:UDP-glucose 4-epimerase
MTSELGMTTLTTAPDALRGRLCVLLGGGGFIGTNLARRLAKEGADVRIISRKLSFPGDIPDRVEFRRIDFSETPLVASAIHGADYLFHLVHASIPQTANADAAGDVERSVLPTLRLLDRCRDLRPRRLIYLSSGGTVYGVPVRVPIDESCPTDPISAYGISKLMTEKYVQMFSRQHGFDCSIIRLSNPYGPFQTARNGQGLIAELVRRFICNIPIEVWGDGSIIRDYIYIDDAIDALVKASMTEMASAIYNVGSGTGTSINELIHALTDIFDRAPPVIHKEARAYDLKCNVLDVKRAVAELRWKPQTDLADGLQRAAAWMSSYLTQSGMRVAG